MAGRTDRLKKLLDLQQKLKQFHETRHAGFVAASNAAQSEAQEIASRFDNPDSLAMLFPETYTRRISDALKRAQTSSMAAEAEAKRVAMASARTDMVHENWQASRRLDERKAIEGTGLEAAERMATAARRH